MAFIGRARLLAKCRQAVDAGLDVWLTGEQGVGKTALAKRIASDAIYLAQIAPAKELLSTLLLECWRRGWHDAEGEEAEVEKALRRLDQKAAANAIVAALKKADGAGQPVLILDDFGSASPTIIRICRRLAEVSTVIAVGVEARTAQRPFLFHFTHIEVPRLTRSESEELTRRLLDEYGVPQKERAGLLRHVVEAAQGLPAIAHELVKRGVKRGDLSVRGVRQEELHGHKTVDMTPGIVAAACGLLALRYAVRGMNDADLTVLAGLGTVAFLVLRLYASRLSAKKR